MFDRLDLLLVAIGGGDGGVGRRKPVRVDEAVEVREILGRHQGHVAVHAGLRFWRIVKRPRSEARHPARLPVVVIVEAANPAIVVDGDVQVDLVASRTEFRHEPRVAMEILQEGAAVRLWIEQHGVVVGPVEQRILARSQLVERRILHDEAALPHGVIDMHNRMTRHAAQAVLRLARVLDLPNGMFLHQVGESQRVIVAARAPH